VWQHQVCLKSSSNVALNNGWKSSMQLRELNYFIQKLNGEESSRFLKKAAQKLLLCWA
jgi:hypothetical protein